MRNFSPFVGAIALTSAATIAQSVIQIPPATQIAAFGTSANYFRAVTTKWQAVYDSTSFTSQGVLSPINITQVSFQFGAPTAQPTSAVVTYPQVDVYLQPSAVDYSAQSLTYASNRTIAFPTTPNYTGPVTTTAVSTQGAYFLTIPLTTPFAYDPTLGVDLLFEIEIPQIPAPATANSLYTTYVAAQPAANFCNVARSTTSATATSGAWTGFVPIVQFDYGPVPGAAVNQNLGTGCITHYATMYELFNTPANFDLPNSALTFIPLGGGGYVATRTGAWLPVGSVQSPATALSLADDGEVTQTFTVGSFQGPVGPWPSITIVSNGVISELPAHPAGLAGGGSPTNGTFLNAAPTAFYNLADWDPSVTTGGGNVWYEESASVTTITWENVPNWIATPPAAGVNTFQFQLYPSGIVTIAWSGANLSSFGNNGGALVGYSPGGVNLDPGSSDISAIGANGVVIEGVDTPPLELSASTRPVLGTPWNLSLANIPPSSFVGVDIFGAADPGINDLFFIGMPGCPLRASLDVTNAWVVTGSTHSFGFLVPNVPSLVGFNLFTTSAVFQLPGQNPFGAMTSNGVRGQLGSI